MTRPKLLDLFAGAGGASVGYDMAGFDVVGVDINPQPHYPYRFLQADVMQLLAVPEFIAGFDAVHASPPCQRYSAMSACRTGLADDYPDLIGPVRDLLRAAGKPYVIENVPRSPLESPVMLCGGMFGLPLYRHRLFETSAWVWQPPHPEHKVKASRAGHWEPGTVISVAGNCAPIAEARRAMGIDWMPRAELAEAIPPAYTEFIGGLLLEAV